MSEFYGDDNEFLTADVLRTITEAALRKIEHNQRASEDEVIGFFRDLEIQPEFLENMRTTIRVACSAGRWETYLVFNAPNRILTGMGIAGSTWIRYRQEFPRISASIEHLIGCIAQVQVLSVTPDTRSMVGPRLWVRVEWN